MFHVKHPPDLAASGAAGTNYIDVTLALSRARTTTRRDGSTPSLSLCTPSTAATASCTILRSNGVIGDELLPLAGLQHPPRNLVAQGGQLIAPPPSPARDVEHQPAPLTRLLVHRQPGQLLQRVEHLALAADQLVQVAAAVDAHDRAVTLDVQIDVAVEIQQIQQLLEVVAGDLTLGDQALLQIRLAGRRGVSPRRSPRPSTLR